MPQIMHVGFHSYLCLRLLYAYESRCEQEQSRGLASSTSSQLSLQILPITTSTSSNSRRAIQRLLDNY